MGVAVGVEVVIVIVVETKEAGTEAAAFEAQGGFAAGAGAAGAAAVAAVAAVAALARGFRPLMTSGILGSEGPCQRRGAPCVTAVTTVTAVTAATSAAAGAP